MRDFRFIPAFIAFVWCAAAIGAPHPTTNPAKTVRPLPEGIKAEYDIKYVPDGDISQELDVYYFEKPSEKPKPLLIWIHGGGWMAGSKSDCTFFGAVARGYVVASVEYRFYQKAIFPAQAQDCQAAIRWLRANAGKFNIDPDRIGVGGLSAGGHLAALVGTAGGKNAFPPIGGNENQSDRVQAVLDEYGPTDFYSIADQGRSDKNVKTKVDWSTRGFYSKLIGGARLGEDKEKCDAVSPAHYVSKDNPPFLIIHGDQDPVVPFAQSVELTDLLKQAGVEVTLQRMPGSGHGSEMFYSAGINKLINAFFDKHLMGLDARIEALPDSQVTIRPPSTPALK